MLTAVYFVVQLVVGFRINSLAVMSDAGHMLLDATGLLMALLAISFTQKPATPIQTYGFYRAEILTSFLNGLFLILLSIYILYEAYHRILLPSEISGYPIILVASVGLAVNLISVMLLRPHTELKHSHDPHDRKEEGSQKEKNLNLYGAYLELFADTIGSVGVIIAGIII